MNRNLFLKDHWVRYPGVGERVVDLADFLNGARKDRGVFVGGRLLDEGGHWRLCSSGESLEFRFAEDASWLKDSVRSAVGLDGGCLRSGDLVLVRLKRLADQSYSVDQVALLFAADDGSWQNGRSGEFALTFSHEVAASWEKTTAAIREFFTRDGFREVLTPTLVPSPGTELFLVPFVTEVKYGRYQSQAFLPTSPEFHLKKLLVAGWTRIFELKTCFRNEEGGHHHQPEFTMLEWYRAFSNLEAIATDCENLFRCVADRLGFAAKDIRLKRITIAELFKTCLGFELTPTTALQELRLLANHWSIDWQDSDTWDDVFFRLFLSKIEPELKKDGPWLVHGYPPSQAALARLTEDGWADRFEIYWHGLEIANAFHELNDPEINAQRFAADLASRKAAGKIEVPVDQELMRALYTGMPPSGGIALGVDRLFMAMLEIDSIEKTRAFPFRS